MVVEYSGGILWWNIRNIFMLDTKGLASLAQSGKICLVARPDISASEASHHDSNYFIFIVLCNNTPYFILISPVLNCRWTISVKWIFFPIKCSNIRYTCKSIHLYCYNQPRILVKLTLS